MVRKVEKNRFDAWYFDGKIRKEIFDYIFAGELRGFNFYCGQNSDKKLKKSFDS